MSSCQGWRQPSGCTFAYKWPQLRPCQQGKIVIMTVEDRKRSQACKWRAEPLNRPRRWATGFSPKQRLQSRSSNANRPTIRSSKKMNSKNESIPCLLSRFHPCTLAPQLPCSALLRSSKKTQKIFFYSKSYVNSARLANQPSPIIKKSSASIRVHPRTFQPSTTL